jgi:hypothetical protein
MSRSIYIRSGSPVTNKLIRSELQVIQSIRKAIPTGGKWPHDCVQRWLGIQELISCPAASVNSDVDLLADRIQEAWSPNL